MWKGGIFLLDNKQRAHDLACAVVPILFKLRLGSVDSDVVFLLESEKANQNEKNIDIMELYTKIYESALRSFTEKGY